MRQTLYEASAACPARLQRELEREASDIEDNEERDRLEDEENSSQQGGGAQTWAKDFFDCVTNPSQRKCLLPVEATKTARAHKPLISAKGGNTALKRHLKSSHHVKAMLYYTELVQERGVEPSIAALETINEMKRRRERIGLKFANGI